MPGGANRFFLVEAPRNYQDLGACDEHGRRYVRPPAEHHALAVPPLPPPTSCTRRGDRCRPSTPPKSATVMWSRAT
ncbi:CPCC family cysteine-rich protein [Streptomyces sp. NPDC002559]